MIFVEPEEGVGDEIVLNFVAAVIVDERAPVGMCALARVRVFVEMGAVKLCQAVGVSREMRGCPVENDADAGLMAAVDKFHEFGRGDVAAGGGEIAEVMEAPRSVEGGGTEGGEL